MLKASWRAKKEMGVVLSGFVAVVAEFFPKGCNRDRRLRLPGIHTAVG